MKLNAVGYVISSALLIAVALVACAPQNEAMARATAAHPLGRAVFETNNCIRCHDAGDGGYGKRMIGNPKLRDLAYIKNRIINGKTVGGAQMPGYPDLPKRDLEEVAQFVRALAGWEQ